MELILQTLPFFDWVVFFTMYMGFNVYIVLLCTISLAVFCKCSVCTVVRLSVCVAFLCLCAVLNVLVFAQLPGG
jgi:hypothetical protein